MGLQADVRRATSQGTSETIRLGSFARAHWQALTLAFIAMLGETAADLAEPWPIKVIVDNVVQSKKLPGWLDHAVAGLLGSDRYATLNIAVIALMIIAVVGAVSTYAEKSLT